MNEKVARTRHILDKLYLRMSVNTARMRELAQIQAYPDSEEGRTANVVDGETSKHLKAEIEFIDGLINDVLRLEVGR